MLIFMRNRVSFAVYSAILPAFDFQAVRLACETSKNLFLKMKRKKPRITSDLPACWLSRMASCFISE